MKILKQPRFWDSLYIIILFLATVIPGMPARAAGIPAGLPAGLPENGAPAQEVIKTTLANGLTIIINPNVENEVVEFQVLTKMGQAYEEPTHYGISALLQRVITRGSSSWTAKEIDLQLESDGAFLNTDVNPEYGELTLKCTTEVLAKSLPMVGEIILNPSFPAGEVEKERQMLAAELAGAGDQPEQVVMDIFAKSFYGDCPYGVPAEQLSRSIATLGREDLLAWHRRVYTARNMVISVVGRVNAMDLAKKLRNIFQKLPAGETMPLTAMQPPVSDQDRITTVNKQTQALFMMFGYPAPDMFSPDWPAMTVLNWILGGGGMSSRLFTELREQKSLAYDVDSCYRKLLGSSYIAAFIATAPGNYEAARDGLLAAFQRFITERVSPAELADARRAVRGRFLMAHETNAGRAGIAGRYELYGLGYQFASQYPRLIDKVSAEDVQRVAQKYFRHYTLGVVTPLEVK